MPFLLLDLLVFSLDSDDRQAAASEPVIGAVGKIAVGTAAGAVTLNEDVFRAESGIEQLAAVGFH